MRIEHAALYAHELDRLAAFYIEHFGGRPGAPYHNPRTGLRTVFLSFAGGARLEIMHRPGVLAREGTEPREGWAHLCFALKSREAVDGLTEKLRRAGCTVESGPRTTGDGYYESCVLDPEGNRVELMAQGAP